ncbi:C-type lectin domain family 2 member D3 isoform X1 [Rattus norvegicus]|uniref:C-type lectin domain family 2 member D3 isoform X1 n=1 Tax=Rattus norvegicus TaxID=10116 RepID=UPI001916FEDE|nr:C-type lectin domain family 2 member D3 isoform X1 [Rattus norvegicus]
MVGNTVLGGRGQAEEEGDLTMSPLNPRPYSMSSSAHLQDAPPLLSGTLTQNEGQTSLRQSSSCGPSAASASESLSGYTESRIPHSKVRQGKGLRSIFPESRVKRYCCYGGVITVVAIAIVVPLSVTLSVKQMEQTSINNTFAASINNTSAASINNTSAACPSNWTEYEFPKEIQREFGLLDRSAQRVIRAPLEVDRQYSV